MLSTFRINEILTDQDCRDLGQLLGYPRAGAKRSRGAWSRYHKLRDSERLRVSLQQQIPIAAAYFRFSETPTDYSYDPKMQWAVLDFDAAAPEHDLMMREYIRQIWDYWLMRGIQPCLTHSGSKGWHLWIFLDRDVEVGYWRGLFRDTLHALGSLTQESGKWHHHSFWDPSGGKDGNGDWISEVDPLVKGGKGKGGIVKLPFSQHQARKERFEFPVARTALDTFQPVDNPSRLDWEEAVRVLRKEWQITQADVVEVFPNLQEIGERGRPAKHKKGNKSAKRLPLFQIPAPGTATRQDEMDAIHDRLPCLQVATEKSRMKEVRYDLRTPVVQIFSALDFTREEIAAWISRRINDAEDDLNPQIMVDQVNHWHQFDYLAKCSSYNTPTYVSFCCPGYCGRSSPLDPEPTDRPIINIPSQTLHGLEHELEKARRKNYNVQLFKSTRIGATTGVVLHALRTGEKLFVVVPTTKIATATIQAALDIYAREPGAQPRYAVVLVDTRKGCLIRAMDIDSQKMAWDNEPPALDMLPWVSKPPCGQCRFNPRHNPGAQYIDREPFRLLHESDLTNYRCQFVSAMDVMQTWDIVVITAAKLRAMSQSQLSNTWGKDTWVDYVQRWAEGVQVVFLDEVSIYTDAPDLQVLVHRVPLDESDFMGHHDLESIVNDQARQIVGYRTDETAVGLQLMVDDLNDELRPFRQSEGVVLYDRKVTLSEMDDIGKLVHDYQKRIETYAMHTNIALVSLFQLLSIAPEMQWIVVNEPDGEAKRCLSVYIAPKFPDVFKTFLKNVPARLIASDATMPLFDLGRVLGKRFEQINVGDPWALGDLQKIIPFQISIPSPSVDGYMDWVVDFLKLGEKLFGTEFTVAVPSKRVYRKIMVEKDLRHMDVMWHRSSESVGVASEKRTMFGVCAPYEPGAAEHWKKVAYPSLFEHVAEEDMWKYEMHKTLFQSLSRVKDPDHTRRERSVYIAFGHTEKELSDMAANVVECPEVISLTACHDKEEMVVIPLLTGWFWKRHGLVLTPAEQKAVFRLWKDRTATVSEISLTRAAELVGLLPGSLKVQCARCAHRWSPRTPDPVRCPGCRTRAWK